ncbi:hypothetical protein HanIR_Chr16g0795971 [Helianthus annuus]|nr:hypothetical protein HanIR_Chr16g0795971 [Helianthus annuus]
MLILQFSHTSQTIKLLLLPISTSKGIGNFVRTNEGCRINPYEIKDLFAPVSNNTRAGIEFIVNIPETTSGSTFASAAVNWKYLAFAFGASPFESCPSFFPTSSGHSDLL